MNNARRIELCKAKKLIGEARDIIEDVMNDEEMAFDNLPEGLQQTMRGETMEENVDILSEMLDNIDDVIDKFDEVE